MVSELQLGDLSSMWSAEGHQECPSQRPIRRRDACASPRPANMSEDAIRLFAISKLGWIKRQQRKQRAQDRETPREYIERESHYLWGRRYLLRVVEDASRSYVARSHRHIELGIPLGPILRSGAPC